MRTENRPWPALWALVIGFFMILLDSTIVMVANPAIMRGLGLTDFSSVMWVTSAYLLASAVPLLITGRLGDRFGPKNIYLIGLAVFTLASAACGLAGTTGGGLGLLVAARVVQGLGGAMMTPQTLAIITRTFAPEKRGPAMGLWGAVAGVATLVGPILGGVLTDSLGWEWIFFINVPIGVVAFIAAAVLVPKLETHEHSFDWLGVVLSAVGLFLVIFGVQEGERYNWGPVFGGLTVWEMIGVGAVVLALFLYLQSRRRREPLLPLRLFADRNFSVANGAISLVGLTVTSMSLPMLYFLQLVRGMTPTQSALMMAPSAIMSLIGAPLIGMRLTARNSKWISFAAMLVLAGSLAWYAAMISPTIPVGWLLLPSATLGIANAGLWSPLATTATRDLAPRDAGAGAGVYNTTRQIGSVLGSAGVAAMVTWAVGRNLPPAAAAHMGDASTGGMLPDIAKAGFTTAMAQAALLPIGAALIGALVVLMFRNVPTPAEAEARATNAAAVGVSESPLSTKA